jgi:cytochrome c
MMNKFNGARAHSSPLIWLALSAGSMLAAPAQANDVLLKKYSCVACHAMEEKMVGPAFKEISKRYAGQADAQKVVIESIKKGGTGKWGKIPMPPASGISDDDAKALATWVLSQK